jgi:hypothetical protein
MEDESAELAELDAQLEAQDEVGPEIKRCTACEKGMAIFGLALGLMFVFISVDVLTGGRLTGFLGRGVDES